jgi:phosphoribosylformimino-5-aminoimidazole carboxamide ribotide isomerase
MMIIPVVDLRNGQVVHAYRGMREHYRPVQSHLTQSSHPPEIVAAFLDLFPFTTIYLADLDAIQGRGNNRPIIEQLTRRFRSTVFWIDAGTSTLPMRKPSARSPLQPVLGSESLTDLSLLTLPCTETPGRPPILSLDFLHDRLQGPPELLERTEIWPQQVIVMSIDAIGAAAGPDYKRIEAIRHLAPAHDLFAAGGVRDRDDIERLAGLGVSGALVASALHQGRIGLEEILAASISPRKPPAHPWD